MGELALKTQTIWNRWMVDDFTDTAASLAVKESPLPRLLRVTILLFSSATLIFIFWAAVTPVKELARSEGQVLPSGNSQLVQHLEGGLVRAIAVREGDRVQRGQLLMQLDGAGLEEDSAEQQSQVLSLWLQRERLLATLQKRQPNFAAAHLTPAALSEQQQIFAAQQSAQRSERAVLDEQIGQRRSSLARLNGAIGTAMQNLAVAQENQRIFNGMTQEGLASRTAALDKEQLAISRQGEMQSVLAQREEASRELAEFIQRRAALDAQQRDQGYNTLHELDTRYIQAVETLKKRSGRVGRLEVRAPVAGYVKGITFNTIGAVVPAGQTLMEIVPMDEQLVVEAHILPEQVGRMAVGQKVQVKVDSYDYVRYGAIPGEIQSISAMTFTDPLRGKDYYKGRIRLARNYAGNVPGEHRILPGMTVDADIVTGEKTILGYLLKPIQRAMQNSLSEQ